MMTKQKSKWSKSKNLLTFPFCICMLFLAAEHTKAASENSILDSKINAYTEYKNMSVVENYMSLVKNDTIRPNNVENVQTTVKTTVSTESKLSSEFPPSPPSKEVTNKKESNSKTNSQEVKGDIQSPEFPGGLNAFRTKLSNSFDTNIFSFEKNKRLYSLVHFIIETDGTISNVTAKGNSDKFNKEAIRSVQQVCENIKWKPQMENGKAVAAEFNFPIVMFFQQ